MKKLIEDSASEVREATIFTLGKIKGTFGDSFIGNSNYLFFIFLIQLSFLI